MKDHPTHYRRIPFGDDKTYKAEYLGSGTFVFSKPSGREQGSAVAF